MTSQLFDETVGAFIQNDWRLKGQFGKTAHVYKDTLGMPLFLAVVLMVLFSLFGTIFVLLVKSASGNDTYQISQLDDGQVKVIGKRTFIVVDDASSVLNIAMSGRNVSYAAIILFGLFSMFFNYCCIVTFLPTSF
jgi:hypothetical protein